MLLNFVDIFPKEISQRIFELLSLKELGYAFRVCKKWNKIGTHEFWKQTAHSLGFNVPQECTDIKKYIKNNFRQVDDYEKLEKLTVEFFQKISKTKICALEYLSHSDERAFAYFFRAPATVIGEKKVNPTPQLLADGLIFTMINELFSRLQEEGKTISITGIGKADFKFYDDEKGIDYCLRIGHVNCGNYWRFFNSQSQSIDAEFFVKLFKIIEKTRSVDDPQNSSQKSI